MATLGRVHEAEVKMRPLRCSKMEKSVVYLVHALPDTKDVVDKLYTTVQVAGAISKPCFFSLTDILKH
jgi:hypothetical protein